MDHLTPPQLAALRAKLEAERERLTQWLAEDADELAAMPSAEPGDIEDAAAEEAGSCRANTLRERERTQLVEIEAALARMHDGTYGVCEDSDEPIPYRRLEAEPTTRYTVAAQEQRERERGVRDPHGNEPIGY
jgi:DnaK suppressor protein